ncbi:MAG: hypothetical protein WC421_04630 [Elusimicrobiales bacterium]
MEFEPALKALISRFEEHEVSYALIGGFGMGALGIARATIDLDFLILKSDMPSAHLIMLDLGYRRVYFSGNVSQYQSDFKVFGSVDIIHAARPVSMQMLKDAVSLKIFGGSGVRVLLPEDIIGLKVQAMSNDAQRAARDSADIEEILCACAGTVSWPRLEKYFGMFGMSGKFKALKAKYAKK